MCYNPLRLQREQEVQVPCGKCYECLIRRASSWSFRMMQESKISVNSLFITLTYAPEHCPVTDNGYMALKKRDTQLFWKRLRKAQESRIKNGAYPDYNGRSIRYFLCGEYGSKTNRPHYHAIAFNVVPELIAGAWGLGHIHIGNVGMASCQYVTKYMLKSKYKPWHSRDDRPYEFQLMSKGLGANYLTDEMIAWHKADLTERMYCPLMSGEKMTMPRYYKERIYTPEEREEIAIAHIKRMRIQIDKEIEKLGVDEYHRQKTMRIIKMEEILRKGQKRKNEVL